MLSTYSRSLTWVLKASRANPDPPPAHHCSEFYLIAIIPKGFFPQQDTGAITGSVRGPQDASFPVMNNSILQLVNVIKADPAVADVIAHTGGGGASNSGTIYIALKPLNVRKVYGAGHHRSAAAQTEPASVASAFLQAAQDLRIGGRSSNAMLEDAASAYRDALKARPAEDSPFDTAKININLAYTLGMLWNRTRDRRVLDEALDAVEAALGLINQIGAREHIPTAELARETILAAMGHRAEKAAAA